MSDLAKRCRARAKLLRSPLFAMAWNEVGDLLESKVKGYLAKGVGPLGEKWLPRKDGSRALPNVVSRGITIQRTTLIHVVRIIYPYQFHNIKRPMIPNGIPESWRSEFRAVISKYLGEIWKEAA